MKPFALEAQTLWQGFRAAKNSFQMGEVFPYLPLFVYVRLCIYYIMFFRAYSSKPLSRSDSFGYTSLFTFLFWPPAVIGCFF